MRRVVLAFALLVPFLFEACVSVSVDIPESGGTPEVRETQGVQVDGDLRQFLTNTCWQWDGPNGEEVVFQPDGYVEHPGWSARGLVTRWEAIDRRTVLFTIEQGRQHDVYAILVFGEDMALYSGFNFTGGLRLLASHRLE